MKSFLAQDLSLKIHSKNIDDLSVLDKIKFKKSNHDTISIGLEIIKISNYLKTQGYFTHSLDSIKKNSKNHTAYFTLNTKVNKAILKIKKEYDFLFDNLKSDSLTIPIENLEKTLLNTSRKLDIQGHSFSKVQLKNVSIQNKILIADLEIHQSNKRYFNKIIVKGYKNFPKTFLKNHFKINNHTIFNQKKIKEIYIASKSLNFVDIIKPPEVLFTKDSTLLYLYFKKKQNNSFDGIVNFTTDENGNALFNGNLDLKLKNTINQGERLELFWNSIREESQELRLSTEIPYLLNTKLTPSLSFSIFRQDSVFLNTKLKTELYYNFNTKSKIALNYSSESSENLKPEIENDIATFKNYFLGFTFNYTISKNDSFLNDKFNFEITPSLGKRNSKRELSNQFKIEASTSFIWDINMRNSFYIKNKLGYLNSNNYLTNELFRIGGAKSIRGFNEQSIFTSGFTYFNIEYRYLANTTSYLYSITDYGKINKKNFIGLGLGYRFIKNKSIININTVLGNRNNYFRLDNIQLNLNWITFF